MIIYFSGSGNSEYVAKYLADKLDDEIVNLKDYIKENKQLIATSEKPYVVIAPVYISVIPLIVEETLSQAKLDGSNKMYFVMTCAGSGSSASYCSAQRICEALNKEFMGIEHFSMPQNYVMFFKLQEKEANIEKFNKAIEKLPALLETIQNEKEIVCEKPGLMHKIIAVKPMIRAFEKMLNSTKKFYVTDKCISCGICEKSCPTNTIKLVDGKPVWTQKMCIHCTSCINKCPKVAIEFGDKGLDGKRYLAPKYTK